MEEQPKDYKVGFGRPPEHSRFKPGQSGNPRGRARGASNFLTDVTKELNEQIRVREGDRERSMTKQRALVKAMVAKALKGDVRSAALLIALMSKEAERRSGEAGEAPPIGPDDEAIIEAFLQRRLTRQDSSQGGGND